MEDESIYTKNQPKKISEGLQNFIDSMVEEIVLEGKTFDSQKKYLKKFSEKEGLDYNKLETDINSFIEVLDSLKAAFSNVLVKLAEEKGHDCHISEPVLKKLISHSSQPQPIKVKRKIGRIIARLKKSQYSRYAALGLAGLALLGLMTIFITQRCSSPSQVTELTDTVIVHDSIIVMKVDTILKITSLATQTPEGLEAVDLGLPSGTKWANMNVGATKPEDHGDFFAWGETKGYKSGKRDFSWSTYKWCNGAKNNLTKYCDKSDYGNNGFTDNKTELDLEDDAAYVKWGGSWQMPTLDQIKELREKCKHEETKVKGVSGIRFTGPNGRSIFFPNGNVRKNRSFEERINGYWTSTLDKTDSSFAYGLYFYDSGNIFDYYCYFSRFHGHQVRPVIKEQNISLVSH